MSGVGKGIKTNGRGRYGKVKQKKKIGSAGVPRTKKSPPEKSPNIAKKKL